MARCWPVSLLAIALVTIAISTTNAGDAADAGLKALAERAAQGKDIAKLRDDLFFYRNRYPGTDNAVRAAGLLRDLPSPLDKLEATVIPDIEKFDWHPKETVAILGEHRGRQGGAATAVAWSKNGKWLASTSTNGYVRIWEPATMRLLHTLGHGQGAYCVAFSKDNTLLAHGGGDGQVRFWEMMGDKIPKEKGAYKVSSGPILSIAIAPNNKWFVAGGSDSRVYYWDLTTDPPREVTGADAHKAAVHGVALSPDAKTIGSASADKTVRLWTVNAQNQMKEKAFADAQAAALSLAWHPTENKTIVTGGADGVIRIWTADSKLLPRGSLKGKAGAVNGLAFAPSGKTLAAAYADGTVRTFTVGAGTVLTEKAVLDGHIMAATGAAFAPDGQTVASASTDWTVRQWLAVAGPRPKDKTVKVGHLSHVYTLAFAPDEKGVASGAYDNTARYWEIGGNEAKERTPSMKGDGYITTLAFAPDGKSLAAGGQAAKFRTYDVSTGRFVFQFQGHASYINRIVYAPDGKTIATCSADKTIRLWDTKTGQGESSISKFETFVNNVAYSPDGKNLLCASGYYLYDKNSQIVYKDGKPVYLDSTVRLYDSAGAKEIYRWKNDMVLPSALAFSPDAKQFFAGASDLLIRRWDTATPAKEPETYYKGGNYGVSTMACSPDGRWLASWGPDYQINLYELTTGKKIRAWTTGEQFGNLAFAQDSRHLAISVGTGVILVLRLEESKK